MLIPEVRYYHTRHGYVSLEDVENGKYLASNLIEEHALSITTHQGAPIYEGDVFSVGQDTEVTFKRKEDGSIELYEVSEQGYLILSDYLGAALPYLEYIGNLNRMERDL